MKHSYMKQKLENSFSSAWFKKPKKMEKSEYYKDKIYKLRIDKNRKLKKFCVSAYRTLRTFLVDTH